MAPNGGCRLHKRMIRSTYCLRPKSEIEIRKNLIPLEDNQPPRRSRQSAEEYLWSSPAYIQEVGHQRASLPMSSSLAPVSPEPRHEFAVVLWKVTDNVLLRQECSEKKERYDTCFIKWYSESAIYPALSRKPESLMAWGQNRIPSGRRANQRVR